MHTTAEDLPLDLPDGWRRRRLEALEGPPGLHAVRPLVVAQDGVGDGSPLRAVAEAFAVELEAQDDVRVRYERLGLRALRSTVEIAYEQLEPSGLEERMAVFVDKGTRDAPAITLVTTRCAAADAERLERVLHALI